MNLQVLNDQNGKSEKWGVSFNGNNPDLKGYVECATKKDAFKLKEILESN